jgi:ribonucleotide monophosphatase NagD (HAD superfamily)
MTEEELASFSLDKSVVAVTVGINFTFNYRKLCIASLYINENKADFIGTNPDRNTGNGIRYIPGGGTIIKAIETATGVKAKIMGKPSTYMFDIIRKQHSL